MHTRNSQRMGVPDRILSLAVLALLTACSSMPVPETVEPREAERSGRAEPETDRGERSEQAPAPAVVVERRRRDYPEIETDATGFTITEQVRISGDVRADYERALQLLHQNRYDEGVPLLVMVTQRASDVTAPFIDLGIAYGESGDLERAEAALTTALALSPDHPIAHNELGILYRKTGRFAEARAAYERALAIFSDFHFARRNLAVLCDLYLGDLGCALENYTAYMNSVVDDADVAIWIADIRNRLGVQEGDR